VKRIFLILASAGLLFVGCEKTSPPQSPKPPDYIALQQAAERFSPAIGAYGGEMALSMLSEPVSFNPIIATDPVTMELTRLQYEGLARISGVTCRPEPNLAQSWETSADGLVWTFHIRQGAQWSDGTAFSAYDVEFTFKKLVFNDSINQNPSRDLFLIKGKRPAVDVIDNLTIRFTLPSPYAPFLRLMTQEILPKHKYSTFVRGGRFATALTIQTPPDSMTGTGPFLLELFVSSQKAVFKKNPLYWKKDSAGNRLPYLDRVVYMLVLDRGAEKMRFLRKELDYLPALGEEVADLQKERGQGGFSVIRCGPASGSNFLFFNLNTGRDPITGRPYVDPVKQSWFRNEAFRKAVALSLDKQTMIDTVLSGQGYPQCSPMSPADGYFCNPDVALYNFDTAKARAWLASAGFKDKNDHIIEDSGGHAVEFSLFTNQGNNVREKIAALIIKDLGRLGFKVRFQTMEFEELINRIDKPPYAWDAALLGLSGAVEPNVFGSMWRSSGDRHMWFPKQKLPSTPWEAAIDSIFEAGVTESDENKRIALYGRWQQIAAEKVPCIYTVLPERIICISEKFKNINPSVSGGILHNLEYIFIQKKS
jgi:peptide/nickel transport system substrate-binding protein